MPIIHYGSNSQSECGAAEGLVSLKAAEVTCQTCRGWLPIVAPKPAHAASCPSVLYPGLADCTCGYSGWKFTRIRCSKCGKSVSSPVSANTVVRAWVECPECIEAEHNDAKTLDEATFVAFGEYLVHNGPIHDDGCPGDDTCDCSGKRLNDGANDAYKFLAALRAQEQP